MSLALSLIVLAAAGTQPSFNDVVTRKPDADRGREIYAQCARCHGPDGAGQETGSVPRIAGQHYRVIVRQILEFRAGKHWDMRMEEIAKDHKVLAGSQQIADVALYVAGLDGGGTRGVGDGRFVAQGESIYTASCASCHGRGAEGDARKEIPRLAGQHEGYLLRQIYDAVDGRRPELARSHRRRLEPLTFEEVQGLADYLSRLGR